MQILQSTLSHVLIGVPGAVIALSARAGEANNADIFGKWTVVAALDSADVAAIDDKQAKRLVGKPVSISKDSFKFDGRVCRSPTYARTQEISADYFREQMHATTDKLRLPAIITSIDARRTFLFLKADGKLMFMWKGFFFDAQRKTLVKDGALPLQKTIAEQRSHASNTLSVVKIFIASARLWSNSSLPASPARQRA